MDGAGGVVAAIVCLGLLRGQPLLEMLLFGIALAVAAVPEALPAVVNMAVFTGALAAGFPLQKAMSMTFVSLVLLQFLKAYNYRSDRRSVFDRPFANRWLNLAIAWELVLLYLIMSVPLLEHAFGTVRLTLAEWALLAAAVSTVVPVIEL